MEASKISLLNPKIKQIWWIMATKLKKIKWAFKCWSWTWCWCWYLMLMLILNWSRAIIKCSLRFPQQALKQTWLTCWWVSLGSRETILSEAFSSRYLQKNHTKYNSFYSILRNCICEHWKRCKEVFTAKNNFPRFLQCRWYTRMLKM